MTSLKTVRLPKTYPVPGVTTEREDDWGPALWAFLSANIPFAVDTSPVRVEGLAETIRERLINYVFARLIVAGCYATEHLANPSELRYARLESAVDLVLDVDDHFRARVVWYLDRICTRVLGRDAELSTHQIREIRKFATAHSHRCYLCGRVLHYQGSPFGDEGDEAITQIRQKRAFEIEHIWSQARGGRLSRDNLAASCNECNKIKKEALSPADLPLEAYQGWANEPESVKSLVNSQVRVALFWRQHGACAICSTPFYALQTDSLYLIPRETDQPFHFFNMMICCDDCNSARPLTGVQIR